MKGLVTNPVTSGLKRYNVLINHRQKYKQFLPSFTPVIDNLSTYSAVAGEYTRVYVSGSNFLLNGVTYINFGNFKNIPVVYYSSFNLSFVIPLTATAGNYSIVAVNIYNGNFSPQINHSYPASLNYSNSLNFTLS